MEDRVAQLAIELADQVVAAVEDPFAQRGVELAGQALGGVEAAAKIVQGA